MTTAIKKKRTWTGLACPVCRLVFRVPKGHDGKGVICPACRYLLNIPEQLESPRLGALSPDGVKAVSPTPRDLKGNKPIASRTIEEADKKTADLSSYGQGDGKKRVRRSKAPSAAAPTWDADSKTSTHEQSDPLPWIIGGSLIGLLVVLAGGWLVWDNLNPDQANDQQSVTSGPGVGEVPVTVPVVELTPEEVEVEREIEKAVHTGMSALSKSEGVITAFLNAGKWEDLEKLVRNPEIAMPRMKKWYSTHEWNAPGCKKIAIGNEVSIDGPIAYMPVRLNDYTVRYIAVAHTPDGYVVDWESWVAWSDMDWKDLFESQPEDLVEVRVTCYQDDYYNRMFSDENRWVSVRLEHPDEDRSLYGYIDQQKVELNSLSGDLKINEALAVRLKVRFPKDSTADNQVIIEEYIQSGWVKTVDEKSAASPAE